MRKHIRHSPIKHVENTRYSNYKSRVKQILTYVQDILDMIQISVKNEVIIIASIDFDIKMARQKYRVYTSSSKKNPSLLFT